MRNTFANNFVAVFQIELLFNLKRVAPYALMIIFSLNALLWWGGGPAVVRGWAVNSDFYIIWLFGGFSFMTLPLFVALMMGDPVIRDFRVGVDPLIFSKPVSRLQYLLGKFFGNFFVLVCCQACFALTALGLQAFSTSGMIVLPPRVLPYFQHFFFFVVVSSLALAVVCFTVGTLTRNAKLVYGLTISSYFLYIAWQFVILGLPLRWRIVLDPLLFNVGSDSFKGHTADWLNHQNIGYDRYMIANRVLMIAFSLACLAVLHLRFSRVERATAHAGQEQPSSTLNLTERTETLYNDTLHPGAALVRTTVEEAAVKDFALPPVHVFTLGSRAHLKQLSAALGVEFRLLRAERSLVVIAPILLFLCTVEIAFYRIVPDAPYSAIYAGRTANALLLFLFAVAVFYTGESIHRDREARIEPVLWSMPVPSFVILFSKFTATLLLSLALVTMVALTAIVLQLYKGHAPLELQTYFKTYTLILFPGIVFMIAAAVALNILLRDKYLAYAVSLAIGGATYYLISQGRHNWLYNPLLYGLWTPADLSRGGSYLTRILIHRVYILALSALLLALALLFFERKSSTGLKANNRLNATGWTILVALASTIIAIITGLIVNVET